MDTLVLKAYAKINLGLDVVRRREDGYHEVKMVMQTVDISDVLHMTKSQKGITVTTEEKALPTDQNNLIYKTAQLMIDTYGITEGIHIHLEKNIPIAAGMAGGSTDAAATFIGMNRLFELGVSEEELRRMAVTIGADVPYCIMGGTALSEGIGEVLTPLPDAPQSYVLVAKPDISVSTKFVYENLQVDKLKFHPDIDGMVKAIARQDKQGMVARMENVLETVTIREYPMIARIKEHMRESGAQNALMSGSGPTVFGIFEDRTTAEEALQKLKQTGLVKQIFVTTFVRP